MGCTCWNARFEIRKSPFSKFYLLTVSQIKKADLLAGRTFEPLGWVVKLAKVSGTIYTNAIVNLRELTSKTAGIASAMMTWTYTRLNFAIVYGRFSRVALSILMVQCSVINLHCDVKWIFGAANTLQIDQCHWQNLGVYLCGNRQKSQQYCGRSVISHGGFVAEMEFIILLSILKGWTFACFWNGTGKGKNWNAVFFAVPCIERRKLCSVVAWVFLYCAVLRRSHIFTSKMCATID